MKVTVALPGKFKSKEYETLANYYVGLISKFAQAEIFFLSRTGDDAAEQSASLLKWMERKKGTLFLTVLDEKGKRFASRAFAAQVEKIKDSSISEWIIAVGGAHGYSDEVKKQAQLVWSLSEMTMAHELAAVCASEQIFRAFSILNHHPYHND